jgi:ubiquinone/menaquinone biosynthesis C-methylase UbiE
MEQKHYNNIVNQFAQRIQTYEKAASWMLDANLLKAQIKAAGSPKEGSNECLDLCCGTGIVGRELLQHGWNVTGIDITPQMVEVANKYFKSTVGSIENMPFESQKYDLVIIRQAFMLVNGDKTLKEIRRILKPNGRFILIQSVSFSDLDDAQYEKVQKARHINMLMYYRTIDLKNEIQKNGLEVIEESFLTVQESIDHWIKSAPELSSSLREKIRLLISHAPSEYKVTRNVKEVNGELFENWNWVLITSKVSETMPS